MKSIILILVFSLGILIGYNYERPYDIKLHQCEKINCTHKGEIMNQFIFQSKHADSTDEFKKEITHFMNPTWSLEKCEEYVKSGVE